MNLDRARGALWGQAIGDALGATHEGVFPEDIEAFPDLNTGPQTEIVGGGGLDLVPGQVTDDTHMAICLAESLVESGEFRPDDVARRYCAWKNATFDIGKQTRDALTLIQHGSPPLEAGYVLWEKASRQPAANGSLMRTSPIPIFFADDPIALRRAALADSVITHADPRCRLACAAFGAAVRNGIVDTDATPTSMWLAAVKEIHLAAEEIDPRTPQEVVEWARDEVVDDLNMAGQDDPDLLSPEVHMYRYPGYVRVALRISFWELLHAPDFEAALIDCTNRGGDADTNTAVTGVLWGALTGEAGIREDWRERVFNACTSLKWQKKVWSDQYHPRRLFRLVENDAV
ncbi:MAG: ADP-ribosylglycohydrolase family protein [Planctomycetota bacterium]|nr:ADP-ribosylglycohydrolase family protein [Planctomycetota bacterium]